MLDKYKVLRTAEKYVLDRKFAQAVGEYRKLLEQDPEEPTLLNTVGDLLVRQGKTEQALDSYRRVAEIYLQGGFTVKALAMHKKILSIEPNDVRARENVADLYEKQGLAHDAARELKALVDTHEAAGRHEPALTLLKKLTSLVPEDPDNWARRARLFAKRANADTAMGHFAEAIRLYRVRGDFDGAFDAAREALSHKANDHAALQELVEVGDQSGRLSEVQEFLENQLDSSGREYPFRMFLGLVRERRGDLDGAGDIFKTLQAQGFSDPIISQGLVRTGQAVVFDDAPGADVELPSEEGSLFPGEETGELSAEGDAFAIELDELGGEPEEAQRAAPGAAGDFTAEPEESAPEPEKIAPEPEAITPAPEEVTPEPERPSGEAERYFEGPGESASPLQELPPEPPKAPPPAGPAAPGGAQPEPPEAQKLWEIPLESESVEEAPAESSGLFTGEQMAGDLDVFSVEPPLEDDLFEPEEVEFEEFQDESLQVGQPEVASLEEALEEVDFYLKLGFRDDGKALLEKLLTQFPGDERVLRRAKKIMPVEELEKLRPAPATAPPPSTAGDFEDEIETALGGLFEGAEEEEETEEVLRYEVGEPVGSEGSNPDIHYNLGLAYKEMGLTDDAIQEFLKADEMLRGTANLPQRILCCSMLANSYLQLGDHREAAAWAREGLKIPDKKDFERKALEYDLAIALEGQGKLDEAKSLYDAILSRDQAYRDVAKRAGKLPPRTQ